MSPVRNPLALAMGRFKKEFVFTLDPAHQRPLLVRIAEVEWEEGKLKWKNRRKLYRAELFRGVSATSDLEALNALLEEKMRVLRKLGRWESSETVDLSEVQIEAKQTLAILKVLAGTGKLYFGRKPITANFFSELKIRYVACRESNGGVYVQAKLVGSTQEFDLRECEFLFSSKPYWVIHRGCLMCISNEVVGKWMVRAFFEDPLTSEEALEFYEEVGQENIEGERTLFSIPDPLPVLFLTDPRGVFANLHMNYDGALISIEDPRVKGRKKEAEAHWKRDLIEAGYIEKRVGASLFYCPLDGVEEALQLLLQVGWEVRNSDGLRLISQTSLDMQVDEAKEVIEIRGTVEFDAFQAPLSKVVNALLQNERFISLSEGTAGLISKNLFKKNTSALFEGEIFTDRIVVKKQEAALIEDLKNTSFAKITGMEEFRHGLADLSHLPKVALSPLFLGKLRSYQERGVAWLSFLYKHGLHGILADEMGLGKTVQVIAFLSTLTLTKPALIVMPKSLLFHWQGEIERFLPTLSAIIYHGSERNSLDLQKQGVCVILTTYSTLRQDIELFKTYGYSVIILDEAQAIKNKDTQTAQAVSKLTADFRLSITGTPIENHMGELLSQFQFLMPGLFGEEWVSWDISQVRKKVRPFILRRKKNEVAKELPEKIEQVIWLEMDSSQRTLYNGFLTAVREGVKISSNGGKGHRMKIFEAILRLRQICCHPLLFQKEAECASIKFDALFLDLETVAEEGQKALVFSQFTSMLKMISQRIDENGWKYCYLDGETKNRHEVVKRFQEDPETQFFLISLKAGGVGMNLTAADYVFLYDPWWNKAVEEQAIDRAHRIGRRHPVIAKRYLIRGGIEERMMQLKESKQAYTKNLFEEETKVFSEDELEYLLS